MRCISWQSYSWCELDLVKNLSWAYHEKAESICRWDRYMCVMLFLRTICVWSLHLILFICSVSKWTDVLGMQKQCNVKIPHPCLPTFMYFLWCFWNNCVLLFCFCNLMFWCFGRFLYEGTPVPSTFDSTKICDGCESQVYWTVHHLDSWIKIDQLDVTRFIISPFTAQHVSNGSTSIFRSLWLIVD